MSDFPHLLEPITLGDLTLRNRGGMGSMHTGLEDHVWQFPRLAAFFAERARGGVGLIITGGYAVNRRGWLKPGYYADVVVFDPATIRDNATFAKPHQLATGVKDVFVNGVQVWRDGQHTGAKPGRFVRGPGWTGWPGGGACRR